MRPHNANSYLTDTTATGKQKKQQLFFLRITHFKWSVKNILEINDTVSRYQTYTKNCSLFGFLHITFFCHHLRDFVLLFSVD